MDAARTRAYVIGPMNLLLLLSALLSALTGVGGTARGVGPVAAVTERAVVPAVARPIVRATRLPVAVVPARVALARVRVAPAAAPRPSVPVFEQRRRE